MFLCNVVSCCVEGYCAGSIKFMKKKYIRFIVTMLTLIWMGIIFYFSSQPAVQSASLSGGILRRIQEIVSSIPVMGDAFLVGFTEHILRKGAHMTEYAILGMLLILCMYQYLPEQKRRFRLPAALLAGILYAGSDEFHQTFVPGRSGELRDVLLDSVGVLVGIAVISAILACIRGKKEVY